MTKARPNKRKDNRNKVTLSKLTFHELDWLEYITMGLGFWFLFYPRPYDILFTALLCMPILGLILNGITGRPSIASLVEISKDDNGRDKYDVADFIDFAAWIILLRVLLDYEFESFNSMIIPGTIAFALMLVILFSTHKVIDNTTKSKTWIYLSLIFNVFLYSYAGTYGVNCVYDESEPQVYETEVVDKRISKGRRGRKTYYVKVNPWGNHYDKEKISVASSQYDEIQIGQTIKIDLKKGLFNIPWYYIE
ncbi:MAG: hypothetical protein COW03_02760 [Cytophagales bacterium CG12_big_fil_rev_8_21_14_0_65_40_12]|nr:MAG: hypothetical protein COW03_02760 [Cytophagales bacterium CG12_big_fil_rev_8_21_14_0_65_40_12]PIW03465.1 MAG: hypothetical protein COW40_15005 [Cytophagales bacterium CG17_big_fil_post_rev_8_21_14_2_50_40_13]